MSLTQTAEEALGQPLTAWDYETLRQVAMGLKYSQVAQRRGCSHGTVKTRLMNIRHKLGVPTNIDALRAVGWLRVPDAPEAGHGASASVFGRTALVGDVVSATASGASTNSTTSARIVNVGTTTSGTRP